MFPSGLLPRQGSAGEWRGGRRVGGGRLLFNPSAPAVPESERAGEGVEEGGGRNPTIQGEFLGERESLPPNA